MKKPLLPVVVVAVLLAASAAIPTIMTPRSLIVETLPMLYIEAAIPLRFGDWQIETRAIDGVMNSQLAKVLNHEDSWIGGSTYLNSDKINFLAAQFKPRVLGIK